MDFVFIYIDFGFFYCFSEGGNCSILCENLQYSATLELPCQEAIDLLARLSLSLVEAFVNHSNGVKMIRNMVGQCYSFMNKSAHF
jgi:hypothetical protein